MCNSVFICWLWQQREAKGNAIMVTIHRSALDEVNGQREKGYTVGIAGTRNATSFCRKPSTKIPIWRQIALVPDPEVDYALRE
jgi:hypothetical protein